MNYMMTWSEPYGMILSKNQKIILWVMIGGAAGYFIADMVAETVADIVIEIIEGR